MWLLTDGEDEADGVENVEELEELRRAEMMATPLRSNEWINRNHDCCASHHSELNQNQRLNVTCNAHKQQSKNRNNRQIRRATIRPENKSVRSTMTKQLKLQFAGSYRFQFRRRPIARSIADSTRPP